ncbi:hypothetical protein [uncultured Peptoniphilus sp.]|uniref:hypothetical protein n=1 Tax=uncultured Peptoniphilus sp. TaxID=254354 RepID=UPI002803768B|nr:hypothetical protein [uncultured Peptoniphilus sp.]
MRYFNKKTGAILDSPSKIYGGQWVEYDKKDASQEAPEEKVEVKKPVEENSTDLTKEEIMNELEALGIDYDKKAKKEDLIKLMMGE